MTVVAGLASTVFLPLSRAVVDRMGWRSALLVLAGLLAACALPQALLLRRAPADLGLGVDGDPPQVPHRHPDQNEQGAVLTRSWRLASDRLPRCSCCRGRRGWCCS